MTRQLRVLDDDPRPAAHNMAADEALLRALGPPTLRLYAWQPHAVSLGWFQRQADFADLPPDIDVVRRATGGGAIWHGDELTFALAIDADRLPSDIDASYVLVHDAVLAALAAIGVRARRLLGDRACGARPQARWCFAEPGKHDLVDDAGRKLVGSAQRRVRAPHARVLHHGSIVLQRPAATPFVAAVADQVDATAAMPRLRRELAAAFAQGLALEPRAGSTTAAEAALLRELQAHGRGAGTAVDAR